MVSTANSRIPMMLAISMGTPSRECISSAKSATVAATLTRPFITVKISKKMVTPPLIHRFAPGLCTP